MPEAPWDSLWLNGNLATLADDQCGFGLIRHGALGIRRGRIAWVGPMSALPGAPARLAHHVHDLAGRLLTPGLIDPHTHVVHAGSRWEEFLWKTTPGSEAPPAEHVGLMWTLRQTRACSEDDLLAQSLTRARALLAQGVTTLESKTGYGLDLETERRMARVSRAIAQRLPITVVSTFLGAHATGPEYAGRPDDYIDFLCHTVLPRLVEERLVDGVDIFFDEKGFHARHASQLFACARRFGLWMHVHADQYVAFGAAQHAAEHGARAVAHLEHADAAAAATMARTGATAVLLPGVSWTMSLGSMPPIDALRAHGVPIALATNSNPGSSPCVAPTAIMNLACRLFGLTPVEALAGFTRCAARALGLQEQCGTLMANRRADLAIWDVGHPAELSSYIGGGLCHAVVKSGKLVHVNRAPCVATQQQTNLSESI